MKNIYLKHLNLVFCICLVFSAYYLVLPSKVFAGELQHQFTVSLWVKADSSVVSKALAVKDNEIRMVTDASGNPLCQIHNGTVWQTAATSSTALAAGTWAYVTCTYDKTTLKVLVNGVQTGSQALTVTVNDGATSWKIGEDGSSTYGDFAGITDDFQIYNYARVGGQITEDYNAGHPAVGTPIGSPVLHLSFDEGYGDTANDKSGQGNNGDLAGTCPGAATCPTWSNDGKYGKALSFDGGDYATLNESLVDGSGNYSVSTWVKVTSTTSNSVFSQFDNPSGFASYITSLFIGSNNKVSFVTYDSGYSNVESYTTLQNGIWYHLLITKLGTIGSVYINGVLDNTGSVKNIGIANTIRVGARENLSPAYPFNGLLDEVKIYNFALTSDQVKTEYNQGKALVLGSTGTESDGSTASNAASREYCVPGDTSSCNAPVAEWTFNEGTGQSANDTSTSGNTGTLGTSSSPDSSDPAWTTGKVGKGLSFDGGDYVDAGNNSALNIAGGLVTFSAWVKWTSSTEAYNSIFGKEGGAGGYTLLLKSNQKIAVYFDGSSGFNQDGLSSTVPFDTWTHISVVWDGTNIRTYINGLLSVSSVPSSTTATNVSNNLWIGKSIYGSGRFINGLIDQVRIYNYARTPAQIAWEYNKGAPVAHYKFDECTGTTINDWAPGANTDSFAGNTGTLNIGATGSQTSAGACESGTSTEAWSNGTSGRFDASMSFDGTDDRVSVADTAGLRVEGGNFAISTWIKPNVVQQQVIMFKGNPNMGNGYILVMNRFSSDISLTKGGVADQAVSYAFQPDTWYHIVAVQPLAGNVTYYINGQLIGSYSNTTAYNSSSGQSFYLGDADTYFANKFNGQIDDVRIYNYALTAEQIKQVYNGGSAVRFE